MQWEDSLVNCTVYIFYNTVTQTCVKGVAIPGNTQNNY